MVTGKAVWLIGRQKVKEGPDKGTMVAAVSRKIELDKILKVRIGYIVCCIENVESFIIIVCTGEPVSAAGRCRRDPRG